MVKNKAFFYYHNKAPGLGIVAQHEIEGWQRVNFYSFGVDMDGLQKSIEESCEEDLLREGTLAARPAQSKVIIAGGVVFKGLTCLAGEGASSSLLLREFESRVPGLRSIDARSLVAAESISPLEVYCYTYSRKVIGISRVVFFEYATQMSLVGVYRDQDSNLVDELLADLAGLHEYMTIPNPLRTDERDQRVEVNMFMIRHPVKEELQADFVQAIMRTNRLVFYTA
ncbi:MAG: hypothetical protein PHP28_07050 [Actinomycetota bacterium]|nr:hypothetical protein [Actinomycetota bacterium]MDD5667176.1 hypothetical protein [Actinomycetota bacterium]